MLARRLPINTKTKQKLDLYFGVKTLYINSLLNDRNYL